MSKIEQDEKYVPMSVAAQYLGCTRQNIMYHINAGNLKDTKRIGEEYGFPIILVNMDEIKTFFRDVVPRGQKRIRDRKDKNDSANQ